MSIGRAVLRRLPSVRSTTAVWDREWDILVVLDGCRLDTFEDVYDGGGPVDSIRSVGATSRRWLDRTFGGRDTSHVGYVTGNPYAAELDPNQFAAFDLLPVEQVGGVETVDPAVVTDRAIEVWRESERVDQLVIHYMQPHVPFQSRPEWFAEWLDTETWGSTIWHQIGSEIPREEFLEAYRENLRWVLGDDGLATLQRAVDAKVAVTADHGNAAGEWGIYGHPDGAPISEVREVPWVTIDAENHGYQPTASTGGEFDQASQLEALGYRK